MRCDVANSSSAGRSSSLRTPSAISSRVAALTVLGLERDVRDELLDGPPPSAVAYGAANASRTAPAARAATAPSGPHERRRRRAHRVPQRRRAGQADRAPAPRRRRAGAPRCSSTTRETGSGRPSGRRARVSVPRYRSRCDRPAQRDRAAPVVPRDHHRPGHVERGQHGVEVRDAVGERCAARQPLREPHAELVDRHDPPAGRRRRRGTAATGTTTSGCRGRTRAFR